jgi:hypothetical protein
VAKRCDAAAQVYQQSQKAPAILCLSAGTAHMPQLLSVDGLPVWESTSSATYLLDKLNIPPKDVFVETTSYDTISNAYFARTSFTDVIGWKRLLIITNEVRFMISQRKSSEFVYFPHLLPVSRHFFVHLLNVITVSYGTDQGYI